MLHRFAYLILTGFLNTGQKSRGIVEEEPFSLIKEIDLKITDEILKDLEKLGYIRISGESRDPLFPEYYFIKWTDVETLVKYTDSYLINGYILVDNGKFLNAFMKNGTENLKLHQKHR